MELKNKIINVLGDSITEGYGTSSPEHIFHAVLGRSVGAALVRNYGQGGTRYAKQTVCPFNLAADSHLSSRYRKMADDADLVLVFGGTNDYGHGDAPFGTPEDRTEDTFCGACHVLFRGLIEKYPTAQIVVMTPLQCGSGRNPCANTGRPLIDYVDMIIRIAGEYALPVLDLYRVSGICPEIEAHRAAFCPDGLHPNDAGSARIAARLESFLKAL